MTTDTQERSFGWLKQPEDPRDYQLARFRPDIAAASVPSAVDLRGTHQPPIGNQGQLGSCVAWACVRAYRFVQRKQGLSDFDGSELFTYFEARKLGGLPVTQDSGSYLRDGIKALAQSGNAPEDAWPYDIGHFTQQPPQTAYTAAQEHQATRYLSIANSQPQVKGVLASGYPVVYGMPIYENFPMQDGVATIPLPQGKVLGGHAMALVGYDDARQAYLTANSWGAGWGDNGFAWLPYAYFDSQATDLWMIETVEGESPPPPPPPPTRFFMEWSLHHFSDGTEWFVKHVPPPAEVTP